MLHLRYLIFRDDDNISSFLSVVPKIIQLSAVVAEFKFRIFVYLGNIRIRFQTSKEKYQTVNRY